MIVHYFSARLLCPLWMKKWMNCITSRVFLEEFARDSYKNLLFLLCRFREIVGKYPENLGRVLLNLKCFEIIYISVKHFVLPRAVVLCPSLLYGPITQPQPRGFYIPIDHYSIVFFELSNWNFVQN